MICIEKKCDINDEWERFITSSNHENGLKLSNYELFNNTTNTTSISNKTDKHAKVIQPKKESIQLNDNPSRKVNVTNILNNILEEFEDNEITIEEDHQQDQPIVDFENAPQSTPIYISTKTNIAYLNNPVDIRNVFWEIPTIPYSLASEGVIKKQIKLNSLNIDELNEIKERLKKEMYFEEHVITHIDNTHIENIYKENQSKRVIFKDIRKISIGLSKKDITCYRNKKKSAFYNCFVLILRLNIEGSFREFHVKVFNTGKLEIPGIQKDAHFNRILDYVITTLKPLMPSLLSEPLDYKEGTTETVLINSNFNCGYYINREAFYDILRYKYNIQAIYDPCSYPGIQCKFYFNPDINIQSGSQISEKNKEIYKNVSEVSFMVFRTGSVLIVGKCDESILYKIYDFLQKIFQDEFHEIGKSLNTTYINKGEETRKKKIRKKILYTT